jgi:S1-C subfamily serine protease
MPKEPSRPSPPLQGHWTPLLSVVFLAGLTALAALSLKQHKQLETFKSLYQEDLTEQVEAANKLVGQVVCLQQDVVSQINELVAGHDDDSPNTLGAAQQAELEKMDHSLQEVTTQIAELHQQVSQLDRKTDFQKVLNQLSELDGQLQNAKSQVRDVLANYRQSEDLIAQYAGGICLIQGEYEFIDPETQRPLRFLESADLSDSKDNSEPDLAFGDSEDFFPVSVNGEGERLTVQYTGTGFLIDSDGTIVTNRHVTQPWKVSREYRHVLDAGYEAHLTLFQAFFHEQDEPFPLEVLSSSETDDVAILKAPLNDAPIPVLPCERDPDHLKVGQTVIVLGFPTGFDVLLARLTEAELNEVLGDDDVSFDQMARNMSQRQMIQPIATRGMCSRVSDNKLVYDAQTAIGGSGGPVLGSNGKVVAVNTALLKGFAGSNFGIPINRAIELHAKLQSQNPPTEIAEIPDHPGAF